MTHKTYDCALDVPLDIVRAKSPRIVRVLSFAGNPQYAVCGTPYGWLHNTQNGIAYYRTLRGAKAALARTMED